MRHGLVCGYGCDDAADSGSVDVAFFLVAAGVFAAVQYVDDLAVVVGRSGGHSCGDGVGRAGLLGQHRHRVAACGIDAVDECLHERVNRFVLAVYAKDIEWVRLQHVEGCGVCVVAYGRVGACRECLLRYRCELAGAFGCALRFEVGRSRKGSDEG